MHFKECYNDVIEFTTSFGKFYLPIRATLPEHVLEFPESIDFSLCPLRETAKKTFTLKNTGELSSTYEWEISKPFAITPRSGTLLPGQCTSVVIEFKPEVHIHIYSYTFLTLTLRMPLFLRQQRFAILEINQNLKDSKYHSQ